MQAQLTEKPESIFHKSLQIHMHITFNMHITFKTGSK